MRFLALLCMTILMLCGLTVAKYEHYRLPTAVRPLQYNLRILTRLDDPKNLSFEGTVEIALSVLEETRNITLHARNLTINENQINLKPADAGANAASLCLTGTEVNTEHDYFIINTCENLKANSKYVVTLPFAAELSRQLDGYYRSSYRDPITNQTKWLSITQFEPAAARFAFPCFDEPDFKAPFIVILGHHKSLNALSNMPLKTTQPHATLNDYIWSEFEESVPMSTYLVAYSVNDFAYKSSSKNQLQNHVQFRTWARPNAIDQCDYSSEFGPAVLGYYEDFFGIKFPLPKMDQIAIPDFSAGAMENWGLVTYRETALLYSENGGSSFADKQRVASVVAHELAHQWFGNLVTMKWWTDLWLNEGFATYVASLGVEHISPEWRSLEQESLLNLLSIFRVDALESSHPISRPIAKVTEIRESFDTISYNKGSSVLRMMHMFMGKESFRAGLNEYLEKYSYNNAEQDNLWASLTKAAHKYRSIPKNYDIKSIMDSWTLQTGYPILNITRNYDAGTAHISQERYLLSTEASRKQRNDCWWVPLSYTTQKKSDFNATDPKDWLECVEGRISEPKTIENLPGHDEWVIFNVQLTTLYKVNYDEQNWKLIIETLTEGDFNRIHVLNRAQLIDDALTLAWSGDQNYDIAMRLIEYLQREREYLPWKAATENLNRISRIIRQTPEFEFFKRYMQKILSPIYSHVKGLNDTFNELKQKENDILLKTLIGGWSCRFNVGDCVSKAREYFAAWRAEPNPDEKNVVPINLRTTVYCTAIRHGNDDDWQFLWTRYKNSNVAAEKKTILSSLGCSREIWLLQSYLERAFVENDVIRKQDATGVFQAVALNEIGFHLAKNYFMANIEALAKFYSPSTNHLGRLLNPLSKQIITASDFADFKAFVEQNKKSLRGIDQAIKQSLETVLTNVQWKDRNYSEISHAIRKLL